MTTTQPILSLRDLAKEYAGGRIDRQTFRQRRARLLNELASFTPPALQARTNHSEEPHLEPKPPEAKEYKSSKLFIVLSGILVFFILAGSLIFMFTSKHESIEEQYTSSNAKPSDTPTSIDESVAQAQETAKQVEIDPIKDFVVLNDWSPESRTRLLQHWDRLSQTSKNLFSSTSWFLTFSSELRTRVEEERGLAGGEESDEVNSLITFAARLGLDFSPVNRESAASPSAIPAQKIPVSPDKSEAVKSSTAPVTNATPILNDKAELKPDAKAFTDTPRDSEQKTESIKPKKFVVKETTSTAIPAPLPQKLALPEKNVQKSTADPDQLDTRPTTPALENCRPLATNRKIPKCQDQLKNGKQGPWLQLLPGGQFTKGRDEVKSESPSHQVNIGYPFAIGTHEVSLKEFSLFCKETEISCPPQPWQDKNLPVVNVSWSDAKGYAKWLSMQSGRGYRLPTESEWEYAARAGTNTAYPLPEPDLGTYAHFSDRSREKAPLPRKPQRTNPNQFGVFNMAGNVREWVLDSWTDGYATVPKDGSPYQNSQDPSGIVRGGSYADNKGPLHSSARQHLPHTTKDAYTGFRLVRDVYLRPAQENLTRWGDWWLSFQQDTHLTLQLLTTNDLNQAQRLIHKHPRHPLKVISSNQPRIRYLVLSGLYHSESAAINAYKSLPKALQDAGSDFAIKSIRELR